MSSRVLKQQLSALTKPKAKETELGPKKKELKRRRKSKAKPGATLVPVQEQPDKAKSLSKAARQEILQRNLQYLAAGDTSEHAENARQKMLQVLKSSHVPHTDMLAVDLSLHCLFDCVSSLTLFFKPLPARPEACQAGHKFIMPSQMDPEKPFGLAPKSIASAGLAWTQGSEEARQAAALRPQRTGYISLKSAAGLVLKKTSTSPAIWRPLPATSKQSNILHCSAQSPDRRNSQKHNQTPLSQLIPRLVFSSSCCSRHQHNRFIHFQPIGSRFLSCSTNQAAGTDRHYPSCARTACPTACTATIPLEPCSSATGAAAQPQTAVTPMQHLLQSRPAAVALHQLLVCSPGAVDKHPASGGDPQA